MFEPTIAGVIQEADALESNTLSQEEKVRWLSRLDGKLWEKYIRGRSGAPESWEPYTPEAPGTTPLLVSHPWDDIYVYWLRAQIAQYNGENDVYNDCMALYKEAVALFAAAYAQEHPRIVKSNRFRF